MQNNQNFSCYIVGNGSLLVRCAELILQKGHQILGVIASDDTVRDWADAHDMALLQLDSELPEKLAQAPFDFLFSIANLSILPKEAVTLPKRFAVNFHDGPLPRYAGLNAPAWAIINGERDYGISWHIMTDRVDEGDVLKQQYVAISDSDTAFTLNAKCYDAAIHSFDILVDELAAGEEKPAQQDLTRRTFFTRDQRPNQAGLIDWNQSAQQISAYIRALDFGPYTNPLNVPKIMIDSELATVSGVEIVDSVSDVAPGTIVDVTADTIQVATTTQVLKLSKIAPLVGDKATFSDLTALSGLQSGQQFPMLDAERAAQLNTKNSEFARHESFWLDQIVKYDALEIPFAQRLAQRSEVRRYRRKGLDLPPQVNQYFQGKEGAAGDYLLTAFVLYLSRIGGQTSFDVDFRYAQLSDDIAGLQAFFATQLPLHIDLDDQQGFDACSAVVRDGIQKIISKKSYSRDIRLRYPELRGAIEEEFSALAPCLLERVVALDENRDCQDAELVLMVPDDGERCVWCYDSEVYSDAVIERMQAHFITLLDDIATAQQSSVAALSILPEAERQRLLVELNATDTDYAKNECVHTLFEAQVRETPDAVAIAFKDEAISYDALNRRSNQLAHYLTDKGIGEDALVGVMIDRSIEMLVAMMGTLKAGAAYVPLDPSYPKERLDFIAEDAGLSAVLTQSHHADLLSAADAEVIVVDEIGQQLSTLATANLHNEVTSDALAYVIYTSGSTGKPKGVMVEHRNVNNFFVGMDERIGDDAPGVWLAVTSISFDISVLELFWTLARGYKVVLFDDDTRKGGTGGPLRSQYPDKAMDFSLFYWNITTEETAYDEHKYRLLMESARYGDEHGFKAVWTPERHFHSFGGLYPNPSVTSAAVAATTQQIQIRAGSCVLPLHSPIRVAEEWAVVDNISNGRVGLAIAAGWQPNDFVIKPENHADAKNIMFESIEQLKRLWRGETVVFPGPKGDVEVQTLPRPVQDEVEIWITVAGNPETFKQAGRIGANVLTHLLGQSVEQVAENIALYRQERKAAGHAGDGEVALLLHTLVGDDEEAVKNASRGPMKEYLKSAVFLVKAAAWHFPTFKDVSAETGKSLDDYFATISDEDLDAVLEFAFERYFSSSGLFGTPARCLEMVDRLKEIGVNEIGCLIDYGISTDLVLEHLPYLNRVREAGILQQQITDDKDYSIPVLIQRHGVTHFQCTPSMAGMLVGDTHAHDALRSLRCMMVGGEAFPTELATALRDLVSGKIINMYGPTETTIWSATHEVTEVGSSVPIGRAVANTQLYVLDQNLQPLPMGVAGELFIGGDGVVRGYLHRLELTDERFIPDPITNDEGKRLYRTGDIARFREDGVLEFLGRIDHQVKIRGFRIELGEIEAVLSRHSSVKSAVVMAQDEPGGHKRLVSYVVPVAGSQVSVESLREYLLERLPEFMVPSVFVALEAFPLTPNGKVDRRALTALEHGRLNAQSDYVAPATPVEEQLAAVLEKILDVEQVGMQDDFFELGGHSLAAAQVVYQIRQLFDVRFPLQNIFQAPRVGDLAVCIEGLLVEQADSDELSDLLAELDQISDDEAAAATRN